MENIRGCVNYSLLRKLFAFLKNICIFEKYPRLRKISAAMKCEDFVKNQAARKIA
jgi:hypothetical protein